MPRGLKTIYNQELAAYRSYFTSNDLSRAWSQLERAHILGQPWAVEHTQVHWLMLKFGFKIMDWHEILGQLPRLLVGGVKSFVGTIPMGNTGGANVPPLRSMDIPQDLKLIMKPYLTGARRKL